MLCFLLLRLGSMSPSSGRDRQHAFLKQEAQRKFVTLPAARRIECDLFAAVHESAIGTKRTFNRSVAMSAFDPKRTLHFGLLSRSGATLIHEGQRFWAAHVAGLQSVKLETAVFDQLLDWSVEVTTTANTFPSRS